MKRVYLIFLVLMVIISAKAEEIYKNEVGVSVGLDTNDAYELEASYRYFLTQNVAIGAGVGFYQQYFCDDVPSGDLNDGKWTSWRMADDDFLGTNCYVENSCFIDHWKGKVMLGGRGRIENANPYGYGKCRLL